MHEGYPNALSLCRALGYPYRVRHLVRIDCFDQIFQFHLLSVVYRLRNVSEGASEKFLACGKKETTKSYSRLFVHTSQPLILLHGWLLVILLIRELSKKTSRKCKRILPRAEEGHPL